MAPPSNKNKRQRLATRHTNLQSVGSQVSSQRSSETLYYDPDQDPTERARIRMETRELTREVSGTRSLLIIAKWRNRILTRFI